MSRQRYTVGWSDYRGHQGKPFGYSVEPTHLYEHVLPEKFRRYKVMLGDKLIGDNMTKGEAEAMKKLLEASDE